MLGLAKLTVGKLNIINERIPLILAGSTLRQDAVATYRRLYLIAALGLRTYGQDSSLKGLGDASHEAGRVC